MAEVTDASFLSLCALQVRDYFSYEHFYVLYCKFWELDSDHDLFIDASDLARHSEHGTSLGGPVERKRRMERREGGLGILFLLGRRSGMKLCSNVILWF